ncbi:MAG: restriction endonuclease subunit S, partial [Bacteroidota bacterium]
MMKRYETYKDSGIEWIGEIPPEWQVLNFRYVISILTDYTANGSFATLAKNVNYLKKGYSRLIRLTDIRKELANDGIYVSEDAHNFLAKSELFGEEILLANVGAYSGYSFKLPKLKEPATLGPNMFLLKWEEKLDNDYSYYSLISYYLSSQLINKAVSSAQPKLNKDDVKSCSFILPPLQDQLKIVSYLDHQTTQIDQLITKKEKLVELLQEQRQAIIHEAVTKGLDPKVKMKDSEIEWLGEIPEGWQLVPIRYLTEKVGSGVTPKGGANVYVEDGVVFIRSQNVYFDGLRLDDVVKIDSETHEKMSGSKVYFNDVLLNIT